MTVMRTPIDEILTVVRPWGGFEQFLTNGHASVKIITIAPLQRLSLQRHSSRDELWQVIDGPVDVEVADSQQRLEAGGRTWVPRGAVHRMGNPGPTPARVLEVAFGHFDEDDIVRISDDYSRVEVTALSVS